MLRELTTNNTTKRADVDCEIFHHNQIPWKECLGQLWPTSVTFFPKVTIVERVHNMFASYHRIAKNFPKELQHHLPSPIGREHILFYKDGKRMFSLICDIDAWGWLPFTHRWEACHNTINDDIYFNTKEEAINEIMKTLYYEDASGRPVRATKT